MDWFVGKDAALLDFLRRGGRSSELSPEKTINRTLALFAERGRFERLAKVAASEPPRVRAILGALGEQTGKGTRSLRQLRASLNPFSRFDFGVLSGLPNARSWQAKEKNQMRLFEHPDFEQAILQAAEHFHDRGLRPAIIEKDYYVTEALANRCGHEWRQSDLQRRYQPVEGLEPDPAILRRY